MNQFTALGLKSELIQALDGLGIHSPTEIQAKAIPQLLEYNPDFIGIAQTGTGKTAAFLLPLLQLIDPNRRTTQGLIIAPTRELVQQIHAAFITFKKFLPSISSAVVYGGTPVHKQASEIKKRPPQILIGTPGRLIDLIKRKAVALDDCQYLILDEADEMLNMGFQEDVDKILSYTNTGRKIWLFSATMPSPIRKLIHKYMESPLEVTVRAQQRTNENIHHEYILVDRRDKFEALKRIIDYIEELYCVIFCKTKMDTQDLADALNRDGYKASAIHGDLSQQQRNGVLRAFKSGAVNILVATDVVARGIDIDDLTHVIHFALPTDRAYYTHRSGRTARAGKEGISLSIISPSDQYRLRQFESSLKININKISVPKRADIESKRITSFLEEIDQTELIINSFPERALSLLESYTKEELLAKIISREITKSSQTKGKDDLNISADSSRKKRSKDKRRDGRREDRSDRHDRRDGKRSDRRDNKRNDQREDSRKNKRGDQGQDFKKRENTSSDAGKRGYASLFINIGKIDGISKGSLVKLLCKEVGFNKGDIGNIELNKRHSTFQIKSKKAKNFESAINKIKFKGRKVDIKKD